MAPTKDDALNAYETVLGSYSAKYPKAMACLEKEKEQVLTFYDFPAAHCEVVGVSETS